MKDLGIPCGACVLGGEPCHNHRVSRNPEPLDYILLAEAVDQIREVISALVAGLTSDGFTEEQARDIVAGSLRMVGRDGP